MVRAIREQVWVWLDDPAFGELQHIGTLTRGDIGIVRFTYEPRWLAYTASFPVDPMLQLFGTAAAESHNSRKNL